MNAMERIQKMLDDHHDMTMSPFMQTDEADALAKLLALADAAVAFSAHYTKQPDLNDGPAREVWVFWLHRVTANLNAAVAALAEPTP